MKLVKLFDDYLNMAAAQQNISREEYTAHYLSESERDTLGELNDMTLGQLERIEDYAEMIADRMGAGQQLDSWMFSQITVALDNLNAVHDAMDGEDGIEESQVNEKKITVDWNDDENSLVFSDTGMIRVDYDGGFQYRGKWFSTAEHTGPEDLIKDLTKAFKGDKFTYVNESQFNEKVKIIMRSILNKMIPAGFGPSTNPKMRDEMKVAVQSAIEPILTKYDYVVESKESDALAKEIDKAMIKIDDSMSYKDFAIAVATVLRDEYGQHNYKPFMEELKNNL